MAGKLEQLFIGLGIFVLMVGGATQIHASMNRQNGVSNNKTEGLQAQHDDMQTTIYGQDQEPGSTSGCSENSSECGLYEKVKTLSHPKEDIFQTLSAGLFIIPSIMSFLLQPVQWFYGAVEALHGVAPWIPDLFVGGIKILFTMALIFGLVSAMIRWSL